MILIISGTNRNDSNTKLISGYIMKCLEEESDEEVHLLLLNEMPEGVLTDSMYDIVSPELAAIQDLYVIPSNKWIIVSPEYNGSFPGVLKLFIDAISVRKYNDNFADKNVALVGVASGRGGNLRGLEHLTGILHYLKMHVYYQKLPISRVEELVNNNGELEQLTQMEIKNMIKGFLKFSKNYKS